MVNFKFIGLSIEYRLSVIFQYPSFNSLVRDTEVFMGLAVLNGNFFEVFFFVCKRSHDFSSLFGTDIDLV